MKEEKEEYRPVPLEEIMARCTPEQLARIEKRTAELRKEVDAAEKKRAEQRARWRANAKTKKETATAKAPALKR